MFFPKCNLIYTVDEHFRKLKFDQYLYIYRYTKERELRAQTMREFQGRVERSSLNCAVRPIRVTIQRSLSSSIKVLSKSKITTVPAMPVVPVLSRPPARQRSSLQEANGCHKNEEPEWSNQSSKKEHVLIEDLRLATWLVF